MEYTIGKVQRTSFLDDTGHATDGYRVWYKMSNGMTDYVEIEKGQYNAENVKATIEAEIAEHLALMGG